MAEVLIHIDADLPWVRYTIRQVFERMLGWRIEITPDREAALSSALPVISYSRASIGKGFHLPPTGEDGVPQDPPIDPIHATWVMLRSGLATTKPDEHGRSRTDELLAHARGWLDRPVVDQWVLDLAERILRVLPGVPPVRRRYTHIATLDVDNGFKYLGRPLWRSVGATTRDLLKGQWEELKARLATFSGSAPDPFDIYDGFRRITEGNTDRVITNFLVAPRGRYDHAVGLGSAHMVQRMREVAGWSEVGIHPSYYSSDRAGLIRSEKNALSGVIGKPITISRQHFLRFRYPDTFHELEAAGIKEDHSVGLVDDVGFRAGTCTPFPFFDVRADRESELMIFPFQVMDSALRYRMRLTPDDAIATAQRVVDRVKAVKGTFIGVWHERFVSDQGAEKGWRRVVEQVIEHARP